MNKYGLACLFVFSILCIMIAGCMTQKENVPQIPCEGQDPIVGTWIYDPTMQGDAVFLYIFKDYPRYDAIAIPRNGTSSLTYELWATGAWVNSTDTTYNLAGHIYLHDFTTDDLLEGYNNETLTYDPGRDILYNKDHPEGIFTRISCVPKIPEGMNVSIPFE